MVNISLRRRSIANDVIGLMCATLLAACGSNSLVATTSPPRAPAAAETALAAAGSTATFTHLYSFKYYKGDPADGATPSADLINVNGTLYGTTWRGGTSDLGTVFSISPQGKETVLYSFTGGMDGAEPTAGLTELNGVFYGTTSRGGPGNFGTVFEIVPSGTETVLYSFKGGSDGGYPEGTLLSVNGTLYGTTRIGGSGPCTLSGAGCGTVFTITPTGTQAVLYSFRGGKDGSYPVAGLTELDGTLYGTTFDGGVEFGTVFKITQSGDEKVLHRFTFRSGDGCCPDAALIAVNGVLYGTTQEGGAFSGLGGTVFKITPTGKETVLHSFGGAGDGVFPVARLVNLKRTLYGTTFGGRKGGGTVFAITTSGAESVIHSFTRATKRLGVFPGAGLTEVNGTLYGTTEGGGAAEGGTVYSISP